MNLKEQAERGELMLPTAPEKIAHLEAEVAHWEGEARRWERHHAEVKAAKRRLSAKYGAIMRRKPRALWRRFTKRVKRVFA